MENDFFRPLFVNLTGEIRNHYEVESRLPAHSLVIKPLIEKSLFTYVYGLKKDDELVKLNTDILIADKGKYKFDISKECVIGHEKLWNLTGWKRGSIIIVIEKDKINFSEIFKNTYNPRLLNTPNSGNTISAIKKCKEEAEKDNIAICLSASNGMEWLQIFAKGETFKAIVNEAKNYCKRI
jgi:hypothetical protein